MLVNLETQLMFRAKPMQDELGEKITFRVACYNALLAAVPNENIDGNEKMRRYRLALKIDEAKEEIEFTPEEVVKLKEMLGKVMSTAVVGQCFILLGEKKDA